MRGVFDIVGPIMIGPSSSHTAGAVRLGRMARLILGEKPEKATVYLHGSFALTHKGHGTDKAITAGLLGMETDDERIRDVFELLQKEGLAIEFISADLGNAHPNTAKIVVTSTSGTQVKVTGTSIGGGNIIITEINDYSVELNGNYHTLLTIHEDKPGIVAIVSHILAQHKINIAFMRVSRQTRGEQALMILETDQDITEKVLDSVRNIDAIKVALAIPPL